MSLGWKSSMEIYWDILLLLNVLINFVILVLTAWISRQSYAFWRIFVAAVIGGIYVLVEGIFDFPGLYLVVSKILISLLLPIVSFGFSSVRQISFIIGIFYVVSFVLGGAVLGCTYLWRMNVQFYDAGIISPLRYQQLLWGMGIGITLLYFVICRILKTHLNSQYYYKIRIQYADREIELEAIVDTGNCLYTPITYTPVIIVEKKMVLPIMNTPVKEFFEKYASANWIANLDKCLDTVWLERIQLVSCKSIGSEQNLLISFRPDSIDIIKENRYIKINNAMVAIYDGVLTNCGGYSALLHPQVIKDLT